MVLPTLKVCDAQRDRGRSPAVHVEFAFVRFCTHARHPGGKRELDVSGEVPRPGDQLWDHGTVDGVA